MGTIRRESRVKIPESFLKIFAEEHRIVLDPTPGLWPVDAKLLNTGLLQELISDVEFNEKFEVLIVPR